MILLLKMHIKNEQFKMADYYSDEYIASYPLGDSIDYVRFLKLKAQYNSMLHRYRQQSQLNDTILAVRQFLQEYPDTIYKHLANDMYTRLKMSQHQFNLSVSELYDRVDKPLAVKFYRQKANKPDKNTDYNRAKTPWYMMLFEEGHL
jgi:outer membrane protein assembly factor BamD